MPYNSKRAEEPRYQFLGKLWIIIQRANGFGWFRSLFSFLTIAIYIIAWMAGNNALVLLFGLTVLMITGNGIRLIFEKHFVRQNIFFMLAVDSAIGILALSVITIILALAYQYSLTSVRVVFIALSGIISSISLARKNFGHPYQIKMTGNVRRLLIKNIPILCSVIVALLVIIFIRSKFPYPTFSGLDHIHYQVWVNKLVGDHGLSSLFLQSANSSSYFAQPLSYYAVIASLQNFLGATFINLFYYGAYFALTTFSILVFTISKSIFKNNGWTAFFSSCIGVLIIGSGHFYGPHDFYSTSITQLLFLVLWWYGLQRLNNKTSSIVSYGLIIVVNLIAFLLYPFTVIINLPLTALYVQNQKARRVFWGLSALLVSASIVYFQGSLSRLSVPSKQQIQNLWTLIKISYSYIHLLLVVFGLLLLSIPSIRKRIQLPILTPLILWFLILLMFFVSDLPDLTKRFEWYWRVILILIATIPVYAMITVRQRTIKILLISLGILGLISQIYMFQQKQYENRWAIFAPMVTYRNDQNSGGAISKEEWKMLQWIDQNTEENDYIITDPYMGDIVRGVNNRQASSAILRTSGEAPNPTGIYFFKVKKLNYLIIQSIINSGDPPDERIKALTEEIKIELRAEGFVPERMLLVVTPRLTYWYENARVNPKSENDNDRYNSFAAWPAQASEVEPIDFRSAINKAGWMILYQSENIVISEIYPAS